MKVIVLRWVKTNGDIHYQYWLSGCPGGCCRSWWSVLRIDCCEEVLRTVAESTIWKHSAALGHFLDHLLEPCLLFRSLLALCAAWGLVMKRFSTLELGSWKAPVVQQMCLRSSVAQQYWRADRKDDLVCRVNVSPPSHHECLLLVSHWFLGRRPYCLFLSFAFIKMRSPQEPGCWIADVLIDLTFNTWA